MSEAQVDFENALNEYKNRISEYKDAAERIINARSPEEIARQAGEAIGTPLSIELLKHGIRERFSRGAEAVKNKATEAIDKLKAKGEEAAKSARERLTGENPETAPSAPENAPVPEAEPEPVPEAPTLNPEATSDSAAADVPEDVAGQTSTTFEDAFGDDGGATVEQQEAMLDIMNARFPTGLNALTDEQFNRAVQARSALIRAGQARATPGELQDFEPELRAQFDNEGNFIGPRDQLAPMREMMARQTAEPEPEPTTTTAPEGAAPPGATADTQEATAVERQIASNTARVARATGVEGGEAAVEAETGEVAPRVVAQATKTLSSDLITTGETVTETTGLDTDGLGAIVGGVLALGGVLASVFAPHSEEPKKPPNLSVPVVQLGLGR